MPRRAVVSVSRGVAPTSSPHRPPPARWKLVPPGAHRIYDARIVSFALLYRAALLVSAAALAACSGPTYPAVDCHQPVWVSVAGPDATASVIGSWDGWKLPGVAASPAQDGWMLALLELPAGEYGYEIVVDGAASLDPNAPLSTYRGDDEVSLLVAADCTVPQLQITTATA